MQDRPKKYDKKWSILGQINIIMIPMIDMYMILW